MIKIKYLLPILLVSLYTIGADVSSADPTRTLPRIPQNVREQNIDRYLFAIVQPELFTCKFYRPVYIALYY